MAKQNYIESLEVVSAGAAGTFSSGGKSYNLDKLPEASIRKIVEYGLRQYISDGAAGPKGQSQADKDAGVAERVANLLSGTFAKTRQSAGMTLDSVARDMILAAAKAQGKAKPSAERIKELIVGLRDDEARWAKVQAEFDRRQSEESALDVEI